MKLLSLFALLTLPCVSAEEDGDWEFLKRNIPDEKEMKSIIGNREWTESYRFAPAAFKFIEGAERFTVFEGMPHQNFEADLLKIERDKIEETIIGDFSFYPEPQNLQKEDEPALKELLGAPHVFRPFLYLKMCGGFHPDYVIRFTKGEKHCDLLLCFGCGDARILHDGKVIHCHIFKNAWQKLLAPYHKQRPEKE